MVRALSIALLLSSTSFSRPAHGADLAGNQETRAQDHLLLDPQSIAFARLDLTKIDPGALEKLLSRSASELKLHQFVANLADRNIRHLATRLRRLKELNVEQVYLVLTLYNMRAQLDRVAKSTEDFIYAIVPIPAGTDPASVAKALVDDPPRSNTTRTTKDSAGNTVTQRGFGPLESAWLALHFHSAIQVHEARRGNVVLAGPSEVLEYLVKSTREKRPAAAAALAAAGDGPFQLAIAPSAVFTRAAEEILGPAKLGELSVGNTLADGFQWAALGLAQPDGKIAARVVIQSQSSEGAKQMQKLIQLVFAGAADGIKKPDAKAGQPPASLAELARLLDFEVDGNQLQWRIDDGHTPPAKVAAALRPVLSGQQVRLGLRQSINNIRAIGLALHNFHDVYKAFPTPATYDKNGKPLLSWRVHILPYVEEGQLYREFRRDEPWDSEHNKKLIERMPTVYRRPFADATTTKTPYQMPIGEQTLFQPGKKSTFRDAKDGTSKTIGIVEVDPDHEVTWTKPDDWKIDADDPTKGLIGGPGNTFVACFLDVSVRAIRKSIDKDMFRRLLASSDGYTVPNPDTFAD